MNKGKIIITLIVASLLLAGCSMWPPKNTNEQVNNSNEKIVSLTPQIIQLLSQGATVQEIGNPNLTLPLGINTAQIEKFFRLDTIMFALVLRNSMNVVLSLPSGYTPTFSGVLVAPQGSAHWIKLLEIKDVQPTDKNNPYYLTVDNQKLLLTIVDQNGAGSGEGIEKVFALSATDNWTLKNCYYFGGNYSGPETDGDYFAFSIKFSSQETRPIDSCHNVLVIPEEQPVIPSPAE